MNGRPSNPVAIVRDRSPRAIAAMTRAISFVGCTRSVISEFTDSASTTHCPDADSTWARAESFPYLPTTFEIRSISPVAAPTAR